MKRSTELSPLSHDHQRALALAHRLVHATNARPAAAVQAWWSSEGKLHFWIEEEIVLGAWWRRCPDADFRMVARMLGDHALIRAAVAELRESGLSLPHLIELGVLIRRHVRFEERELFPLIENSLDPAAIAELGSRIQAAERQGLVDR